MKLAVLADIHGNYPALQAVAAHIDHWQPDEVVVAGDIVNRGPRSLACLDFIRQRQRSHGWRAVRGNHEDYVISFHSPETAPSGIQAEVFGIARWAYQQLNGDVAALQALPFQVSLPAPDGGEIRVVHASMVNNRNGIFPNMTEAQLRKRISHPQQAPPAVICVAHTHIPLVTRLGNTLIVNTGSAGLPFDGDPRPAYAQLTWRRGGWSAEIVRLPYNRRQAERDFEETGFLHEAGPMAHLVLDELRTAQSRLYHFMVEYHDPTLNGDITLADAVSRFLIKTHGLMLE
ncbi:MAG: metallophosphoesterase family protein [Anaerolineae bacterium]